MCFYRLLTGFAVSWFLPPKSLLRPANSSLMCLFLLSVLCPANFFPPPSAGSSLLCPANSFLLRPSGSSLLHPADSFLPHSSGSSLLRPAGSAHALPFSCLVTTFPCSRVSSESMRSKVNAVVMLWKKTRSRTNYGLAPLLIPRTMFDFLLD